MNARLPLRPPQGMALVLVLWLVALLSMMALSLAAMQRTETLIAANQLEGARARAAAQAALQLAILDLMRPPAVRQMTLDGVSHTLRFGESSVTVSVIDEADKVDLNFASGPLIDELLRVAGMAGEQERAALVDAILDWRDADELRRLHGAEGDEYQAAGLAYAPRNGPFQSIEELSLVLGMNAQLYHRIAGSITIFTGATGINSAAGVLGRLALSDEADEAQAADAGNELESTSGSTGRSAAGGRVVTIRCDAQQPSGVGAGVEAVVRFTPRRGAVAAQHHEVLVWREVPALLTSGVPPI